MTNTKQWLILAILFVAIYAMFTTTAHTVFRYNTPGIDYFIFWNAGHALFDHQDPYSPKIDLQIQNGIYGHAASGNENRMEFAYPAYALLIITPFLWLDFGWSQAAWLSFNILLVISLSYTLFPRSPKWLRLSFAFLYPFVFGYILGNFVVTISAFLLIFLRQLINPAPPSATKQIILGVVMAWSSAKPQYIWAFLILFFLYSFRYHLWQMLTSFGVSLMLMILICLAYRTDWINQWLEQVTAYQGYNDTLPILSRYLQLFLPSSAIQIFFYGIVIIALGISVYLFYCWWKSHLDPLLLFAWLGFVTYLIHPGGGGGVSYEQLILLVPVFVWAVSQKSSLLVSLVWSGIWIASYLCNAGSLLKVPGWFELFFFPIYSIWLVWLFKQSPRLTEILMIKPSNIL